MSGRVLARVDGCEQAAHNTACMILSRTWIFYEAAHHDVSPNVTWFQALREFPIAVVHCNKAVAASLLHLQGK